MAIYTTEVTSAVIPSDNPIHQRLLSAYIHTKPYIKGDVLEVGCGDGRGAEILSSLADSYTAIDKLGEAIRDLQQKYPNATFLQMNIPPFTGIPDNKFDVVISFQVIEHIQPDEEYLREIHRVLKPGGKAIITTPNIKYSLTRNPWHIREYTAAQLEALCRKVFRAVDARGIHGNELVMEYYEENKRSVKKFTRFDIFKMQYWLPRQVLQIPYDILNRMNRNRLMEATGVAAKIKASDYIMSNNPDKSLDLYYILEK